MAKRVLLIAFHFPPVQVSSGLQRTLAFSQYLPGNGWDVSVLTARPTAYEKTDPGQLSDVPPETTVVRACALDTARHLAIGGRYPSLLALPDRWVSWLPCGILKGWRTVKSQKIDVLWSTYPIATSHLLALALHKLTKKLWIADFRDSMTEEGYPAEGLKRRVYVWIEKKTMKYCSHAVFTTPGAVRMYRKRYPDLPGNKFSVIPNGYNEHIFADVERQIHSTDTSNKSNAKIYITHSGVIYPSERDPSAFFKALSALKEKGVVSAASLKVILRATGHDDVYRPMLTELCVDDIVELAPPVDYREALAEMLGSDALLLLQAENCNHQIPAKIYEYMRARRPILGLTDPKGDTAQLLKSSGIDTIAPLDDSTMIANTIESFLVSLGYSEPPIASEEAIIKASREYGAGELARLMDNLYS